MKCVAHYAAIAVFSVFLTSVSPQAMAGEGGVLLDTGPGDAASSPAFPIFNDGKSYQYGGMQFTLDEPFTIGAVQVWMRGFGEIHVKLRKNSLGLPGDVIASETFDIGFVASPMWVDFSGMEWSQPAGTYWITLEVDAEQGGGGLPPNAPNPLDAYAYLTDGDGSWWIWPGQSWGLRLLEPMPAEPVLVPDDYLTIQAAIDSVSNGAIIEVAPGTYNEAINFNGRTVTVRSSGGPEVTIIDATGLNQPAVHVPSGSGAATRLEGFTITGGNHTSGLAEGGGILIDAFGGSTFITVADCIIANNFVSEAGGGAAVVFGGEAMFQNCTFDTNLASGMFSAGGGVYVNTGTATFVGCTFSNNEAEASGGAINVNNMGTVEATDCMFVGNVAGGAGGAVMIISNTADAQFTGCTFDGNTAQQAGGVMLNGTSAGFVNCNFYNNVALFQGTTAGGGLQVQGAATLTVDGCDFKGNNAYLGGGVQLISVTGSAVISNSSFRNNIANFDGGGVQVFGGNPPFIGATSFCGNTPNDISGSYSNGGGNSFETFCVPDNNTPDAAEPIVEDIPIAGTFDGATNSGSSSCDPFGVDVFFTYTVTDGPVTLTIDTCGSAADTALAVFDQDENELGCSTSCSGHPCSGEAACLVLNNLENGEYLIRVSQQASPLAGSAADFVLQVTQGSVSTTPGDVTGDGVVNVDDLLAVIGSWGPCPMPPASCDADVAPSNGDGAVNVDDLLMVIGNWG